MLTFISLVLLALAVSLDGFGAGVTYGLRKIRIPWSSVAIIAGCSGLVFLGSMEIGQWAARWLAPGLARSVGALILIAIGLWAIWQMRSSAHATDEAVVPEGRQPSPMACTVRTILHIELKRLGLVIQLLKTPQLADLDRSGNITAGEALMLGMALSLDALGAGIGAAWIGFAPLLTAAAVTASSGMFIAAGLKIRLLYSDTYWIKKLSVLPGCILIVMGILKLM